MRKCNSLFEERVQVIIAEIQEKAKQICQAANGSGTNYEAPSVEIYRATKELSTGDLVNMQRCTSRIIILLNNFCKMLPEDNKGAACELVHEIEQIAEFPEKLQKIELALAHISLAIEISLLPSQTIISGNVYGNVLSGLFNDQVNIGYTVGRRNP